MANVVDYGQVAYEAYCARVNNKSVHGEQLPKWQDQKDYIQQAWRVAAEALMDMWQEEYYG